LKFKEKNTYISPR